MTYTAAVSTAASTAASAVRRAALCALLGLCLLAGLLSTAGAASAPPTFTVTRTADDTAPGSLRSAIALASVTPGSTVNFQIPATDPGVSGGTATITLSIGPLVVAGSLSIVGPNTPSGAVVVDGAAKFCVFNVTGGTVSFSNLAIQDGLAGQLSNGSGAGGGLASGTGATVTLANCTITGNSGGGLSNSGGTLTLTDSIINGNVMSGVNSTSGTLNLTRCTINGNYTNNNGGGVLSIRDTLLTINGCLIQSNQAGSGVETASSGGGIYTLYTPVQMTNSILRGNISHGAGGGANLNYGSVTMTNCFVEDNQIFPYRAGFPQGGGIVLGGTGDSSSPSVLLTNCVIANNSSTGTGGGLLNSGARTTVINSTFTGNIADNGAEGSAVAIGFGSLTLINDILYGDIGTNEIPVFGPQPTVTYSDVQGGYTGTGNINANPRFVRDADSSVAPPDDGDLHLRSGSPAIHTGTNGAGVPSFDIEGNPRPFPPARPSMGAYEVPISGSFSAQGGFTVMGTQSQSTGTQVVAKFLPGTTPAAGFTATVNFGDGTGPMPGTVSADLTANGVFQVTGSHTYASSGTFPVIVTISGPGGTPTATVTSTANIQPALTALTFPSPVPGGTVVSATVTLSGITPTDTVIGLSSSDSSVARVFRSVIVPVGSSSATFAINTFRTHFNKTVTIQATQGAVVLTKDLTITGR